MTGKKGAGETWRHTTVVLRSDIFMQAVEQGIDISDACNRALAGLTGIDYRQQREAAQPAAPVIIARDGSLPHPQKEHKSLPSPVLHPVINADDPTAASKVVKAKKSVTVPPEPAATREKAAALHERFPGKSPARDKLKKQHKKGKKGDALSMFFAARIIRSDEPGEGVAKDELYERFVRFCRDHRIAPVPERKTVTTAMKNRFALSEEMQNGTPRWAGIRLKD